MTLHVASAAPTSAELSKGENGHGLVPWSARLLEPIFLPDEAQARDAIRRRRLRHEVAGGNYVPERRPFLIR